MEYENQYHWIIDYVITTLFFTSIIILLSTIKGETEVWDEDRVISNLYTVKDKEIILMSNVTILSNGSLSFENVSIVIDNRNTLNDTEYYSITNFGELSFNNASVNPYSNGSTRFFLNLIRSNNKINNTTFTNLSWDKINSVGGITITDATFIITNTTIYNSDRTAINIENSKGSVINSKITNSRYFNIIAENSEINIENSVIKNGYCAYFYNVIGFINNTSVSLSATPFILQSCDIFLVNNDFTTNDLNAIDCSKSNITIISNNFTNNKIALICENSNLILRSSNFRNNKESCFTKLSNITMDNVFVENSSVGLDAVSSINARISNSIFSNITGNAIKISYSNEFFIHSNIFNDISGYHLIVDAIITLNVSYVTEDYYILHDFIGIEISDKSNTLLGIAQSGVPFSVDLPLIHSKDYKSIDDIGKITINSSFNGNDEYYPQIDTTNPFDITACSSIDIQHMVRYAKLKYSFKLENVSIDKQKLTRGEEEFMLSIEVLNNGNHSINNLLILIELHERSNIKKVLTTHNIPTINTGEIIIVDVKLIISNQLGDLTIDVILDPFIEYYDSNRDDNKKSINIEVTDEGSLFCGFWIIGLLSTLIGIIGIGGDYHRNIY